MISAVRGVLCGKGRNYVVLNVGALDLIVFVPSSVLTSDLIPGDRLQLFTHFHVREAEISLYGFESEEQRDLFGLLLEVGGIGPRSALSLLSILSTDVLVMAIAEGKAEVLARAPGVGLKTARRIVLQLQDKVDVQRFGEPTAGSMDTDEDLIAALTALGYSVVEAQRAIQLLPRDVTSLEERLRLALEWFGSKR